MTDSPSLQYWRVGQFGRIRAHTIFEAAQAHANLEARRRFGPSGKACDVAPLARYPRTGRVAFEAFLWGPAHHDFRRHVFCVAPVPQPQPEPAAA